MRTSLRLIFEFVSEIGFVCVCANGFCVCACVCEWVGAIVFTGVRAVVCVSVCVCVW